MDRIRNDLTNDTDVEIDFIAPSVLTLTQIEQRLLCKLKRPECVETRTDSGLMSMGSSEFSLEAANTSLKHSLKSPVQCSDVEEITKTFNSFGVGDDDEGISMSSSRSYDNENSQVSEPEPPQDIEVDLYDRDDDGDSIIHVAIVSLMPESAVALIDLSVDKECLNIQNYLLQSPMHLAVITGQVEIVRALVTKGADVTLRDQQGNTPLHIACRKGDKDSVTCIVQSFGTSVVARSKYFSMKNCEGLTCAHVASQEKEFMILGHLFAKGADVNIGDAKSGRTMLHYAVERRDLETTTLLLTHPNINVDSKTFKGETALVLAYWRNYQDIVKRLKTKGAYFSYDLIEEFDDENNS